MDTAVKSRIPASRIAEIINLPSSFLGGDVDVTVEPARDAEEVVDSLWGCASNLDMSAEDVREERLADYATTN